MPSLPFPRAGLYRALKTALMTTTVVAVPSAFAQQMVLEEVIVTAQKRMETTQETPLSITALSASDIERRGLSNAGDLMGSMPNVGGFEAPSSRGNVSISMRGVSSGSPNNLSLDQTTALYINNVYIGKAVGSALDVADVERIEVLRGPQGTLYGRNSTGGAINFITRRPTGELMGKVTASIGDYDLWGLKANVHLPAFGEVGEGLGRVAISLGAQTRERDPIYGDTNPANDGWESVDRQAWRMDLNWQISDSLQVDYSYDHSEMDELSTLQKPVGLTQLTNTGVDRIQTLQFYQGAGQLAQNFAAQILPDFSNFGAVAGQLMATVPGVVGQTAAGLLMAAKTDPTFGRFLGSTGATLNAYQQLVADGDGRPTRGSSDKPPITQSEVDGHALSVTWEAGELGMLGDVEIKSITALREVSNLNTGDLDGVDSSLTNGVGAINDGALGVLFQEYLALSGAPTSTGFGSPSQIWSYVDQIGGAHSDQRMSMEYEQLSQEFQWIGSTDNLDYVLGLYYFEDEGRYDNLRNFAAPLGGLNTAAYENDTEAWAVFGQATYRPAFDENLSLTAGLRYTEEDKSITYYYLDSYSPADPRFDGTFTQHVTSSYGQGMEESFQNTSGTFTIAYQFTPELNTFLRYATGYRSGGFNGEVLLNSFDEETIEQWELGIKSDWLDRRLRVNGSVFAYTYEDLQSSIIDVDANGRPTSRIDNTGVAERWGGELEITALLSENLLLSVNYARMQGDFEEYAQLCASNGCLPNLDNTVQRPQSGDNQVTMSLDWAIMSSATLGELNFHIDAAWQDESYATAIWTGTYSSGANSTDIVRYPDIVLDTRTLVNARLSLSEIPLGDSGSSLEVALWGKNLLDDDFSTFGINFAALGLVTEQYGEPRTYGLDLSYNF